MWVPLCSLLGSNTFFFPLLFLTSRVSLAPLVLLVKQENPVNR